jgi:hypothetical protein
MALYLFNIVDIIFSCAGFHYLHFRVADSDTNGSVFIELLDPDPGVKTLSCSALVYRIRIQNLRSIRIRIQFRIQGFEDQKCKNFC